MSLIRSFGIALYFLVLAVALRVVLVVLAFLTTLAALGMVFLEVLA